MPTDPPSSKELRASISRLVADSKRLREESAQNTAVARKLVDRIAEIEETLLQKKKRAR